VVWWSSSVEVLSALMRELRDGRISSTERDRAIQRLRVLRSTWNEVLPVDYIKHLAENLLEAYTLRAADAFQLAAALKWCNEKPQRRSFVCFDNRLAESALRAGFAVAPS
jgi:predicted nucleic acid-binding protein